MSPKDLHLVRNSCEGVVGLGFSSIWSKECRDVNFLHAGLRFGCMDLLWSTLCRVLRPIDSDLTVMLISSYWFVIYVTALFNELCP